VIEAISNSQISLFFEHMLFPDSNALPISVDAHVPITINSQIAEQIKLLISIGVLRANDALPTVTQLAKQLSVNHNTIAAVYNDLIVAGYLMAQRGKGTFVANTQVVQSIVTYRQVYELLEETFSAASGLGMSASAFGSAAYAQAVMVSQRQVQTIRVAFVDNLQHLPKLHTVLQSELGLDPELVDVASIESKAGANSLVDMDLIITLPRHLDIVEKVAKNDQELIALDIKPNLLLLADVSALPLHGQVALVATDSNEADMMQEVLEQAGVTHVKYKTVVAKDLAQKAQAVDKSMVAIIANGVPQAAVKNIPSSIKVTPFSINIEQANLLLIKARLATVKAAKNIG
jgi:DNA-binding transcriptional regulator YhcF (GntR family)